ncbi:TDP-N-acetylfucosamine:lipid II N-acetylfucosaminyltransferase [Arsenophonus endosymbiont of Aleurodicus dispersus]
MGYQDNNQIYISEVAHAAENYFSNGEVTIIREKMYFTISFTVL